MFYYKMFIVTIMLKMILIYFYSFGVTVIRFQICCVWSGCINWSVRISSFLFLRQEKRNSSSRACALFPASPSSKLLLASIFPDTLSIHCVQLWIVKSPVLNNDCEGIWHDVACHKTGTLLSSIQSDKWPDTHVLTLSKKVKKSLTFSKVIHC